LAAHKVLTAIKTEIAKLPDIDSVLTDLLAKEVKRLQADQVDHGGQLEQRRKQLERELDNIRAALRQAGPSAILIEELKNLESEWNQIGGAIAALDRVPKQMIAIPPLHEVKTQALQALTSIAHSSPEFGRLMRQLIPCIWVYPYRLCDCGRVVLRARLSLDLVALIPAVRGLDSCSEILRRDLVVDLFDPPQRVSFRQRVQELRAQGLTERQIAAQLGITQPTVQYAAALTRRMQEHALTDPYVPLLAPPDDQCKLTRHLHPRYQFRPLEEAVVAEPVL
jgi:hypothetical protein